MLTLITAFDIKLLKNGRLMIGSYRLYLLPYHLVGVMENKLLWLLGDPDTWEQELVDRYFFRPKQEEGEFEWFYEPHSCTLLPNGDIFLFDNGHYRSKRPEKRLEAKDNYSRGVICRIDEEKHLPASLGIGAWLLVFVMKLLTSPLSSFRWWNCRAERREILLYFAPKSSREAGISESPCSFHSCSVSHT